MAILSLIVTAIATAVIAWCAIANHKLASKIKLKDDEFRKNLSDFYTAMVISNIYSSDSGLDERITLFREEYKGNVPIPLRKKG